MLLMQCGLPREVAEKIYDYRCAEFLDARSCVGASFSSYLHDAITECAQVDLQTRDLYRQPLKIVGLMDHKAAIAMMASCRLSHPDSSAACMLSTYDDLCNRIFAADRARVGALLAAYE